MRLLALITLVISLGAVMHLRGTATAAPQNDPVFLDVGDRFQVSGAPLGCKVVSAGGSKLIDCRIAGPLARSYGTRMTPKRLEVVRFRDAHTANVVFVATQRRGFKLCH